MPVELVTIPGVPLIRAGKYELSTGTRTFAEEDLAAAANALATDAAVKAPRVKIASVEQALGLDPAAHGGEPAFGYVDNLAVIDQGQTLIGDFHVPPSVAGAMEWAYPSLSIEGTAPGWTSATGRSHELVVTAVALLGVHWPGVTTLEDFTAFLAEGPKIEKTEAPEQVLATTAQRARPVTASLDSDLVVRRFLDELDGGAVDLPEGSSSYDFWPRALRFDDSGSPYLKLTDESTGRLYSVSVSVSGAEVTFGELVEIVEQDVPVSAAGRPMAPVAAWGSRDAARAVAGPPTNPEEAHPMTDEQRRAFAAAFGLAEDATVEQVEAAAQTAAEQRTITPVEPEPVTEPTPVAARLPDGVVAIDAAELATLRAGAATAVELDEQRQREDRDRVITAAMREGRFPPARREHYERAWAADREGTRVLLTAAEDAGGLAPNTVPVAAVGSEPQDADLVAAGGAAGTGWFSFEEGK